MNAAIASSEQPQLPIVLVQFDAKYYTGESCHPSFNRVVPIYAKTSQPSNTTAKSMCASSYLWSEQTPLPFIKPKEPAPRSTSCALRERHMQTLHDLILFNATAQMFTKHRGMVAEMDAEYERLRCDFKIFKTQLL